MTILALSPHYDDVVLCAGGLVGRLCQGGETVLIVTVFGGTPLHPLSQQAEEFHQDCGLGDDAVEHRRREDAAAVSVLGAKQRWLDIPDAIYRTKNGTEHLYPSRAALFGEPPREDLAVQRAVDLITEPPQDVDGVLVPLGVGGHVDHRLTRTIGERVIDLLRPASVLYYGESLYQAQQGDSAWRAVEVNGMSFAASLLADELWSLKSAAVLCYSSQLQMLDLAIHDDEVSPSLRTEWIGRRPETINRAPVRG